MELRAHKYLETEETKMSNRRWNTQNIPAKMKVSRVKRKDGTPIKGENMKKKYKGFSKLPESVQRKINKKLAAKV